jgi:hypothetical protein
LFLDGVDSYHGGSGGQRSSGMERGQILKVLDKGGWEKFTGEIVFLDCM